MFLTAVQYRHRQQRQVQAQEVPARMQEIMPSRQDRQTLYRSRANE
jgi:hypothetical protein